MINRDETYIIDIEKEQYLIAKKVKQFDTVFLKYKLYKDSKELNLTGVNLNIKIAKPDKTFIEQTNNYTIENNTISINLNRFATNIPGNCLIDIVIKKSNTQITTFTTTLDIKSSNYYKNVDPKNIVTVLEDLDSSIDLAQDRVNNLDIRNNTATTNINNLDARNNTATTKIRDLDSRNATATTNINNLDIKNNEAVSNKSSLYTENSVAQMHLDELKKKTEVATNTKEELNQFINENKDMAKIHERINNNTKEITNLKDSIAQNRPIVIAEDTPIGSIVWYASEKILGKVDPDVWRVCNGQTLNKADFPDLYDLIKDNPNYTKTATTFNLPDLISSKRFIRAVGDSYNVGYVENDELKSHRHFLVNSKGKFFEISGSSVIGATNNAVDTFFVSGATKPNKVGHTTDAEAWMYATCTNYVGGDETRPKNIQFIPLIKCKCRAKDIVDLATDVEQAKAGFNTLKEAMDSKATKESIVEITEEISNAEEVILDLDKELEEARNGEVSLDARIERDVNKINDNINNLSFLPFEGENIDVNNSLNGYTRDLVIKGKTLHNLYIGNRENTFTISQGQHYNHLTLCETSMLKLNTPYTIYFDIEIISNTTIGNIGDNFLAELGIANNLNSVEGHPTVASGKYNITPIYNTNKNVFTFTDFKGHKYLAIRPLLPPLRPVPTGQQISYKIKNIIILEGDYTNKSIPKYFEGIKSVGELEENKISILSNGKNLLNVNFEQGSIQANQNKTLEQNKYDSQTRIRLSKSLKLKSGRYTISIKDTSKSFAVQIYNPLFKSDTGWINIEKYTIDIESGDEVILIIRNKDNSNITPKDFDNIIQLEQGIQVTSYEKYKIDKKDILLPFENGLKSLPNGVSDEIKKGANEYKINKRVGREILDGTESWIIWQNNNSSDKQVMGFAFPLLNSPNNRNFYVMSNKFISGGTNSDPDTGDHTYYTKSKELIGGYYGNASSTQRLGLSILKSKLASPDVAGLKKYLRDLYNSGDPVVIYYELAEPVVYELDKNLNLEVYKDKTYISSNNSIQPVISCKVPVDVQATISTLRENNKELEEENIKLKNNLSEYASKLEDSNLEMLKQNIDTDFRLMELEFALDL